MADWDYDNYCKGRRIRFTQFVGAEKSEGKIKATMVIKKGTKGRILDTEHWGSEYFHKVVLDDNTIIGSVPRSVIELIE